MNTSLKQKQTHRYREQTYGAKQGQGREGKNGEFGIRRCKLLFIEWINNKVLLYSTRNCIQYPMIKHNGNEYENTYICIYICISESLYYTAEMNIVLYVTQLEPPVFTSPQSQ